MAEKLVKDPERLVATIEASFPYPDQMERYYGFDIQRFQIALPQHMAAELVSASEQQAVIEARQKAAQEAGQKTSDWKRRTFPINSSAWVTNACCPRMHWRPLLSSKTALMPWSKPIRSRS